MSKNKTKKTQRPKKLSGYIQSITLENIKCFGDEQRIDLANEERKPYQWTVIIGDNGIGKTTVLQGIAASWRKASSFMESWKELRESSIEKERLERFLVEGQRFELSDTFWNPRKYGSERGAVQSNFVFGESISKGKKRSSNAFSFESKTIYSHNKVEEHFSQFSRTENDRDLPLLPPPLHCYVYGAKRKVGTISLAVHDMGGDANVQGLFMDTELQSPEQWLLLADYAQKSEMRGKKAQRRFNKVKQVLIELLPGVEEIKLEKAYDLVVGLPEVRFKTSSGWVLFKDLGLGYQSLMSWVIDLASRLFYQYRESKDPLLESAIVLVDEIDLHLHPKWQRQIMSRLSDIFKNVQFIVTAHSPLVVQANPDANIVLLHKEDEQVIVKNDMRSIKGWRVDQILTSDFFGLESSHSSSISTLLSERKLILTQTEMSDKDQLRLSSLKQEIGVLPFGQTSEEMEAAELIQQAASLLRKTQADD